MSGETSFRLVVGQNVFSKENEAAGQLLGFTQPSNNCTVRLSRTGQVVSVSSDDLRLATWDEIRGTASIGSEPSLPTA
ncbi:MAG: hypothetical protein ACYTDT_05125 [Planctomycetota bacterium]|jgi:hypothetical protein